LLVFFALDAAIFRSGLYARIQSPQSPVGKFFYGTFYEAQRPSDPTRDIIVFGNSKVENGFDVLRHEQSHPEDSFHWINGASSSSDMRWWYYKLRVIDPHRDRYRAVVIPLNGYLARPDAFDLANDYSCAVALTPFLGLADWPIFWNSYDDPTQRQKAMLLSIFQSHAQSADIMDLLAHGPERIRRLLRRASLGWNPPKWDGLGYETVASLQIDPKTGVVTRWPEHLDSFRRTEINRLLVPPTNAESSTERYVSYETTWLDAIVDYYRNTHTQVMIVPMPAYPFSLPAVAPITNAPDLRALIKKSPNLTFLDESPFEPLIDPLMFYDIVHLNSTGRFRFTEILTQQVEKALRLPALSRSSKND
jgi:hypothetical protein